MNFNNLGVWNWGTNFKKPTEGEILEYTGWISFNQSMLKI